MSVLSVRPFRWLWLSAMISGTGEAMQSVAVSWLVLELTGSPAWVGLVIAARLLPIGILAIPMGVVADRFSRRKVVIIAHWVMTLVTGATALLTISGLVSAPLLAMAGLIGGAGMAWLLPSWHALYPSTVPDQLVTAAVGSHTIAAASATAIGPLLGGVLVRHWGAGLVIGINALTNLPVIIAATATPADIRPPTERRPTLVRDAKMGLLRIWRSTRYRWLFLGALAITFQVGALQALLPDRVDSLFSSADVLGLLLTVSGVGAVMGAVARGRIARRFPMRSVLPVLFGLYGSSLLALAHLESLGLVIPVLGVMGFVAYAGLSIIESTTQTMTPTNDRGRTMSVYMVVKLLTTAAAAAVAGRAATLWTTTTTLSILGASGGAAAAAAFIVNIRARRHLSEACGNEIASLSAPRTGGPGDRSNGSTA